MKKCPKCKNTKFNVSAHVVQEWLVDENGSFIETTDDCVAVAHFPDNEDLWTCAECGYEAAGEEFENDE